MKNQNGTKQRVELHAHTKMTETFGICSAKELIERAAQYGHSAVAITDNSCVQAFPDAERYGKENGIKIIYGWEADVIDSGFDEAPSEFTVLAKNQQGLKNLYKLVTQFFCITPVHNSLWCDIRNEVIFHEWILFFIRMVKLIQNELS